MKLFFVTMTFLQGRVNKVSAISQVPVMICQVM